MLSSFAPGSLDNVGSKVWVVSLAVLSEHAQDYPAGVFSTEERAEAFLLSVFESERGKSYWWGQVTEPDAVGHVAEFEIDTPGSDIS